MDTPSIDRAELFLEAPLLEGIGDAARLAIFRSLKPGVARKGTPLLSQGHPNDRLWFLLDGTVTVERAKADGSVEVLATLNGPAIYGTTTFFRRSSPTATIRAGSDLTLWTLDHQAHDRLRLEDPRTAEALALGVVQVLSDRFDLMDRRVTELMARHGEDHPKANEWANFRTRLFEEPAI